MSDVDINALFLDAARADDIGIMKEALKRGADPNTLDHNGNSAFHLAHKPETIAFLLSDELQLAAYQFLSPTAKAIEEIPPDMLITLETEGTNFHGKRPADIHADKPEMIAALNGVTPSDTEPNRAVAAVPKPKP